MPPKLEDLIQGIQSSSGDLKKIFNTIYKSAILGQDVQKHITLLPKLRIKALELLHGKSSLCDLIALMDDT